MKNEGFLTKFIDKAFFFGMWLSTIGFIGFVAFIIKKVVNDEGLEYYFTGFGYQLNYLGVLVLVGLIPLLFITVFLINWWLERDKRDLLRKYGKSKNCDKNT